MTYQRDASLKACVAGPLRFKKGCLRSGVESVEVSEENQARHDKEGRLVGYLPIFSIRSKVKHPGDFLGVAILYNCGIGYGAPMASGCLFPPSASPMYAVSARCATLTWASSHDC